MSGGMLHFMESPQPDDLADFLRPFDFNINGFGVWSSQREKPVVEGYICDYQIVYVDKGVLRFTIHEHSYVCESGSLILFEPFVVYATEMIAPREDFLCYTIHFNINPEHRKKDLVLALLGSGANVFTPQELPVMSGMFGDLYQSKQGREMGLIFQTGIHLRLCCLYMLRARWPKGSITLPNARLNSTRETEMVKKSIQYIQKHIQAPLRVSDMAAQLNISENYLYKCFVSVLGMPPSRYILQYKIRLSVEMMTSTSRSMEEIADLLGFSSLYHFSKTFKQIMGSSPRNYVNQLSKGML